MRRLLQFFLLTAALCATSYFLGYARAESVCSARKTGEIIDAEKKKAQIWTRPNARRDTLLELMRRGIL